MELARDRFCLLFNIDQSLENEIEPKIDNYQGSGTFNSDIHLRRFKNFFHSENYTNLQQHVTVKYNKEHFAGLFMKVGTFGKLILYSSGKYSIVGSNGRASFLKVFKVASLLLRIYFNGALKNDYNVHVILDMFTRNDAINWESTNESYDSLDLEKHREPFDTCDALDYYKETRAIDEAVATAEASVEEQ